MDASNFEVDYPDNLLSNNSRLIQHKFQYYRFLFTFCNSGALHFSQFK